MARKRDRCQKERVWREKIRELLQLANVESMDGIHEPFKETVGEFIFCPKELLGGYGQLDFHRIAALQNHALNQVM